jgi:hypothetical protein
VVTKNRPDVAGLNAPAADRPVDGHTTEALTVAMRSPLQKTARTGSLFGATPDRFACGNASI